MQAQTHTHGLPPHLQYFEKRIPGIWCHFPVAHHSQFLMELFKQNKLILDDRALGTITFHDSCYLGRWNKIFDEPRQLITRMNQGQPTIEMKRSKGNGFCCGAGGARMFMEETLGSHMNVNRAKEITDTGAQMVASASPYCITMLQYGLKECNSNIVVHDLAKLLRKVQPTTFP